MAFGKKIDRVDESHLGKLIIGAGGFRYCPLNLEGPYFTDAFNGMKYNSGLMELYEWLPDTPKPERKKPSERLKFQPADTVYHTQEVYKILDEHHERLKALEACND